MHINERKLLYFISNFTEVCSNIKPPSNPIRTSCQSYSLYRISTDIKNQNKNLQENVLKRLWKCRLPRMAMFVFHFSKDCQWPLIPPLTSIHVLHVSHNALVPHPTMHHSVAKGVHMGAPFWNFSVTKGICLMHCEISEVGLKHHCLFRMHWTCRNPPLD